MNSLSPEELERYKISLRNKTYRVKIYLSRHKDSHNKLRKTELDMDEIEYITRISSRTELYRILDYLVDTGFLSYVQGNIIKIATPLEVYNHNSDIKPNLKFYEV